MKKLKWIGSETEFLEFMMFIDTILFEMSEEPAKLKHPGLQECAKFLEHFIEMDYKEFENFSDLKMHGKPTGIFFHGLLRLVKNARTV